MRTTEGGLLRGLAAAWGGSINHVIRLENVLQEKKVAEHQVVIVMLPERRSAMVQTPSDIQGILGLQERVIFPRVALSKKREQPDGRNPKC